MEKACGERVARSGAVDDIVNRLGGRAQHLVAVRPQRAGRAEGHHHLAEPLGERPSDLTDADLEGTAGELAVLEAAGDVVKEPRGVDAIWRAAAVAASQAA